MWRNSKRFPRLEVNKKGEVRLFHAYKKEYIPAKTIKDKDGYILVRARDINGVSTSARVHRLVAEAFIPNSSNKPVVNHLNGLKDDNRVENLRWSTIAENTQHGYDELGVISGQSERVLLIVGGEKFSTYDSIFKMTSSIGVHREAMDRLMEISNGFITYMRTEVEYEEVPNNKPFWIINRKLNTRGQFYELEGKMFDDVLVIAKKFNVNRTTVYQWLKKGEARGFSLEIISCEEYLRNSSEINW